MGFSEQFGRSVVLRCALFSHLDRKDAMNVITVRFDDPELHAALKNKAHSVGMSLNQFCVSKLGEALMQNTVAADPVADHTTSRSQIDRSAIPTLPSQIQ